jgi:hypothetical protein
VLRRIFGPKRDEVTGGWRKLHNEELYNLYSSPSIIRMIRPRRMGWAGHKARMGKRTHVGYCGKSRRKETTGMTGRKWMDNIKMDLTEIGGMVWIGLILLRIGTSGELL